MTGTNGDYYLNTTTCDIFQKVSGTWVKIGNIKGQIGNGLYISHSAPTQPYAGMLWIQAQTIYLRDDSNTAWFQVYPIIPTSKVRAYNSATAQTLSGGTLTKIILPNKEFDTLSEFDTSLYRFTVSKSGYFLITANVGSSRTSTATLNLYIYKNGAVHSTTYVNTTYPHVHITDIIYLNTGDYIELYGASGASVSCPLILGQSSLWMSIYQL